MIYLLEDDASIRNLVLYALSNNAGIEAVGFEKPSEFWHAIQKDLPRVILLDIMLPEEDGLAILKKLREEPRTAKIPVIMLTAKNTVYDKVIGLDSGADDYVAKPFEIMELISRVKVWLKHSASQGEFEYRGLSLSIPRHTVKVDGEKVSLTLKEFELLALLMKNQGIVFNRDQLLQNIWGYEFDGENRTVDVHIRNLRIKLGKCGDLVETVRGVGYKIGENR